MGMLDNKKLLLAMHWKHLLWAAMHVQAGVPAKLEKTFYLATEFSIEDNNGYLLTFAKDED